MDNQDHFVQILIVVILLFLIIKQVKIYVILAFIHVLVVKMIVYVQDVQIPELLIEVIVFVMIIPYIMKLVFYNAKIVISLVIVKHVKEKEYA